MPTSLLVSRRAFLTRCTTLAALTGLPRWFVEQELSASTPASHIRSATDRPGIALVGCGGMGRANAKSAARFGDIVAVCDVNERQTAAAAAQFGDNGRIPARYGDFRRALDRQDVDIVVNATPDHWHTLVNMGAAAARKDIYAEKPLTLTVAEGQRLVRAVRTQRVVLQTGTQQRSNRLFRLACELVRNGRIGELTEVAVFLPAGVRGGPFTAAPVPQGLDWDFWLGQAPRVPFVPERLAFRWWFDYAGGPVTDWGAHHNDIACWAIGLDGPSRVQARALSDPLPGGYTAPPEFEATLTWANGVRQVVRTTVDDNPSGVAINPEGQRNGVRFTGLGGWIWVNRTSIDASAAEILEEPLPASAARLEVSDDHMRNFFDAVRSRTDPICPVEVGHRSAVVGHLIVVALRTGRVLQWRPDRETFVGAGARAANAQLARRMRKPYDYSFVN